MVQDVQLWVRNYEEPIEEVTPPIKARSRALAITARLVCSLSDVSPGGTCGCCCRVQPSPC